MHMLISLPFSTRHCMSHYVKCLRELHRLITDGHLGIPGHILLPGDEGLIHVLDELLEHEREVPVFDFDMISVA